MGHASFELGGELARGFADQIRLADAWEKRRKRRDASGFRPAAGDPENVGEAGQRLGRGIRIGCLGIVDEQHTSLVADLLHAVGEAGKRNETLLDLLRREHPIPNPELIELAIEKWVARPLGTPQPIVVIGEIVKRGAGRFVMIDPNGLGGRHRIH